MSSTFSGWLYCIRANIMQEVVLIQYDNYPDRGKNPWDRIPIYAYVFLLWMSAKACFWESRKALPNGVHWNWDLRTKFCHACKRLSGGRHVPRLSESVWLHKMLLHIPVQPWWSIKYRQGQIMRGSYAMTWNHILSELGDAKLLEHVEQVRTLNWR